MENQAWCKGIVASQQRYLARGFSLLELAVVVIVFSILTAILMQNLSHYQDEAERAGAQKLLANIRSALYGKALAAIAQGKQADLALLAGANPIHFLATRPVNYLGEISNSSAKHIPGGSWYFDSDSAKLVYVFSGKKSFPGDSRERWFFKVEFTRLPTKNAKPDGTPDQHGSVALIQVDGR